MPTMTINNASQRSLASLANLKPNPEWAELALFDCSDWQRVRFGDVVANCNETCNPAEAGLERFVAMEHLEPGSLHVLSWGNVAVGTSAGSLSPRTNWSSLASFEFDLAPLDQQRRIAEVLWAVDEASMKFEQTLAAIKEVSCAASDSIFEANERVWHAKAIDACDRITVGIVVKPASHYLRKLGELQMTFINALTS
ncbi:hypothetical protein SH449x_000553 [Pirellulaceae bacterium SH449]